MPARNVTLSRKDFEFLRRIHCTDPARWGLGPYTDYWYTGDVLTTGSTLMTDGGWTTTVDTLVAGDAASLMNKATIGTPGSILMDATSDLIASPAIFGDYTHAHAAAEMLGHRVLPRYLCVDIQATFSTASANAATTGVGFTESGTTGVTSADHLGYVTSNGTNWCLDVEATVVASAIAVDNNPHWFRLVLGSANAQGVDQNITRLYVDNVLAATSAAAAPEASFPAVFSAANGGATNFVVLSQAHVWYAWQNPGAGISY